MTENLVPETDTAVGCKETQNAFYLFIWKYVNEVIEFYLHLNQNWNSRRQVRNNALYVSMESSSLFYSCWFYKIRTYKYA